MDILWRFPQSPFKGTRYFWVSLGENVVYLEVYKKASWCRGFGHIVRSRIDNSMRTLEVHGHHRMNSASIHGIFPGEPQIQRKNVYLCLFVFACTLYCYMMLHVFSGYKVTIDFQQYICNICYIYILWICNIRSKCVCLQSIFDTFKCFIYFIKKKNMTAIFAFKGVTIGCETRQVHLWKNTAALWTESGSLLGRKHRWSYWDPKSAGDLVHPFFLLHLGLTKNRGNAGKSWGKRQVI